MMKRSAIIFGIFFVVIGVFGFIPGITVFAPDVDHGRLFGLLAVDTMHNMLHVVTGAVGIWMGLTDEYASRMYFRIAGVLYAVLTLLGFGYGNGPMFGMMANNPADAAFHALVAVVALFLGFGHLFDRFEHHPGDAGHHPV